MPHCDVVTINALLHHETRNLFDDELLSTMRRGAYLVNTARGLILDRDAIVRALETGYPTGSWSRSAVRASCETGSAPR